MIVQVPGGQLTNKDLTVVEPLNAGSPGVNHQS